MKKETQVKRIEAQVLKWIENGNITSCDSLDKLDISADLDESLTYKENLKAVKDKLGYSDIPGRKDVEQREEEIRQNFEAKIVEEQAQAIETIKQARCSNLDRFFNIPKSYVRTLLASKEMNSLIMKSPAGLGKTHTVVSTLVEEGLKYEKDFIVHTGYITPLSLYKLLYDNNGKVIVVDDVESVFKDKNCVSLLLSATWGVNGQKEVKYASSTGKLENIPNRFISTSKVIFCINNLPEALSPLKSRSHFYEFNYTYLEKIAILYEMAKLNKIPLEIVDFIKEKTDETHINLDFRLLFEIHSIYKHNKEGWKLLGENAIKTKAGDSEKQIYLVMVKDLMDSALSVDEQFSRFREKTGKSRATYFRYKNEIQKQRNMMEVK